jgi:hypothetical protein
MKPIRRTFIRDIGSMLASSLTTPKSQSAASASPPDPLWAALRQCWLNLDNAELRTAEENEVSRDLQRRHAEAVEGLVTDGKIKSDVADEISVAFEESIAHIQHGMSLCYIAMPAEAFPRMDLMKQTAELKQLADQSDIDPDTIAQAQAALKQDIDSLFRLRTGETFTGSDKTNASPAAAEAARILVDLLLDKQA